MNWLFSLYVAVLFFILTPAVLLRIPKKGSKYTVAGVHAIVFALLLHFTGKFVWNFSMSMEGFREGADAKARGSTDSAVKNPEIKAGVISNKQKVVMQETGKQLCDKTPGKTWNATKKTCDSDPTKTTEAKASTDANEAKRASGKPPTKK